MSEVSTQRGESIVNQIPTTEVPGAIKSENSDDGKEDTSQEKDDTSQANELSEVFVRRFIHFYSFIQFRFHRENQKLLNQNPHKSKVLKEQKVGQVTMILSKMCKQQIFM